MKQLFQLLRLARYAHAFVRAGSSYLLGVFLLFTTSWVLLAAADNDWAAGQWLLVSAKSVLTEAVAGREDERLPSAPAEDDACPGFPDVELNLRYNHLLNRYEVYARPNVSTTGFQFGSCQISIVMPAAFPNDPLTIASHTLSWVDNSQIHAPAIDPGSDFHGMFTIGGPVAFTANQEVLLFSFTNPASTCLAGARLYINGSDPTSSDAGMSGADFTTTMFGFLPPACFDEAYVGNYSSGSTDPNPLALDLTGSTICASPGGDGSITSSASVAGVSYQLFDAANTAVQTAQTGTGAGLSWTGLPAATGYYVVGTVASSGCTSSSSAVSIVADPVAAANAGADQTVCADNALVTLAGSIGGGATSSTWTSSGGGVFSDASSLTSTYTPGAADITAGTVTLTLTTNDPTGPCGTVTDQMTITINPVATANAGADQTVCTDNAVVTLAGSIGGAAGSAMWTSSGSGAFSDASSLSSTYTPSAADITAGSITLTLTTNDPTGPCGTVTDQMTITINPAATANAGADQMVCADNAVVTLAGSIGGAAGSATWTSSGSGAFSDVSSLTSTYTPSAADITAGSVILTLTTNDPMGPCGTITDQMTITINPAATANAGADQTVCADNAVITLAGSIGGAAGNSTWTSSGSGTFSDATSLTSTYTPSAADITAGSVILTLTTNDPAGPCGAVTDPMTITINSACLGLFRPRAMLQGALLNSPDAGLMRDNLRAGGQLPIAQPFTDNSGRLVQVNGNTGVAIGTGVLNQTGSDAIVDWVLLEFRNATDPTQIVGTRAALLQRDGDVVSAADGSSAIAFGTIGESYYLAIKHRNHLGVMTAAAVTVQSTALLVDFTTAIDANIYNRTGYDGMERVSVGAVKALWMGDANGDGKVKYQGAGNDLLELFQQVVAHPDNSAFASNFDGAVGYLGADINLDGKAKYSGLNPDNNLIFGNLLLYPLNVDGLINYDFMVEQLPQN